MSIQLAAVTAADYADIHKLWESIPGVGLGYCDAEKFFAPYLERNPGMSLVAREGSEVVAAVMCGHDGRRGYLSHLAVAPRLQRSGLGRRMVEICLQKLWTAGITGCNIRVYRHNSDGNAFWERLGFRDIGVNVLRREMVEPGESAGAADTILLESLTDDDHLDPVPTINVGNGIVLTPFEWGDQPALVELLNTTEWYSQQMPLIPHPYTLEHARSWITKCMLQTLAGDKTRNWAIRQEHALIGGIGIGEIELEGAAEVGYWLAQSHWGLGLMPTIVTALVEFAFREYPIVKVFARAFQTNSRSTRVLEKARFIHEGTLRRHLVHQGVPHDVLYFGRLREDSPAH